MKTILILAALFSSFSALAAAPIRLTCVTDPPSTSFGVDTEGDTVAAALVFHYGPLYAPAINGVFTPHDLGILAERAELVKKLKDITVFHWPLQRCKSHDPYRFECFGTDDAQDGRGGEKIRPFALYTTRSEEDGIAGKHTYIKVTLSFDVDGKGDPSVAMDYPIGDCAAAPGAGIDRL
jgi:hypothetical protein